MTKFKVSLILILSFVLSACSLPAPEKSDDVAVASFVVSDVQGSSRSVETNSRINFPTTRTYEFKACLQDRAHLKPLSSQQVRIKENNETLWSDPSGCIKWSENVSFSYLDNPEWLTITRTLEGQGYHQGEATLNVAVNPWELPGDSTEVIDLKNTTPEKLKLASKKSSEVVNAYIKSIQIEKVSQNILSNGLEVKHIVRIEPVIDRYNLKNEKISLVIPAKELKVRTLLRQEGAVLFDELLTYQNREGSFQAEMTIVHSGSVSSETKTTADLLIQEDQLFNNISTSIFNLGLGSDWVQGMESKAIPVNIISPEGTPALSKGSSSPTTASNSSTGSNSPTSTNLPSGTTSPILVDQLQSQLVKTISEKESTRTVLFSLKTCVKNKITGKSLNNASLIINSWQSNTKQVTTDTNGCFSIEQEYTFQESTCHGSTKEVAKVRVSENVEIEIPVFINPWNQSSPVQDGRFVDESSLTKCEVKTDGKSISASGAQPIEKNMILAKAQVTPLDQSVHVGNLLELNVKKKIRWEVSPLLTIKGDAAAQTTYSPVRDETWNVELLIQNPWTPASIKKIHYSKTEVKSLSGLILWETEVDTNDLQTMDGLLDVFIRIENKSGTHSSGILRGRIILGADGATLNLEGFTGNWNAMVAWAEKQDALKKQAFDYTDKAPNLQNYAKSNLLLLVKNNPFASIGVKDVWSEKSVNSYFKDNIENSREFCRQFLQSAHGKAGTVSGKSWINRCATDLKKDFRMIFKVSPVYEVKNVAASKVIQTEQRTISLTDGYTNSYSFSESWRHGVEGAVHGGVAAGNSKSPVSGGLVGGYEISWMQASTKDRSIRQTVSEAKNILVAHYKMQTTADVSNRCMSVQINPQLFEISGKKLWFMKLWDFIKNPGPANMRADLEKAVGSKNIQTLQKGILICEPHAKKYNLKDDYYILSEDRRDTSLQNSNDPNSKPWFMAIRGTGDYQQLLAILTSNIPVPSDYTYTNKSVQRLLLETNYFDTMSSQPQVWINPPNIQ